MFQKFFACLKHSKSTCGQFFFLLSNVLFSHQMCIIPSEILILMFKRKTWVQNFEIHVYNTFWQFWFKHVFDPKNYEI
jgi:hypothetical protein